MQSMSKKSPRSKQEQPATDPGVQIPLRLPDARLGKALRVYAERIRRSRNMAIVLLLEEALQKHGLWPPQAE